MDYSPSSTPYYFSPKPSPSSQQTRARSPPTSTGATPRGRPRSTSAIPPSYGYGSPKPPQEQPNPFAEMGIDPVKMYLQRFHLPDTIENRRDAWEIVGRVAQRILEKEEAEARAQQNIHDDEDPEYGEFLAFKEYMRQKNSRRSPKEAEYRPARSSGEGGGFRPPANQAPQAGYIPTPTASQSMLFGSGSEYASPYPAPGTCYYPPTCHGSPPSTYPKTPATVYQSPWPRNTAAPVPEPPQTATPWSTRSKSLRQSPPPLGRP
ncbi:hypothetical protein M407DRAFT_8284 [Tulasnella calospora MUT 4182]|uniref:Uncharacterized protein n=1 Tax=Tulasnella calospora MUT 4182 TaxID=1051891 RepID=A0A0C3Q7L8_9AGAM|nr:hypothetical protein M407DRAFT_8284 [Tulasnella calospora MUT 4182]